MRMMVLCGNEECEKEFYVDSGDQIWICPECGREIINRNYPFLTARLMQARIDRDETEWKEMFRTLTASARKEIEARNGKNLSIILEAEKMLKTNQKLSNARWMEEHDKLLQRAREIILSLEK